MNLNERINANKNGIRSLEDTVMELNRQYQRALSLMQAEISAQASLITELQEIIGHRQIGSMNDD